MKSIVVRFTAEGFHRWPDASGKREYLANRHRHMFHVEVELPVEHDDREVEFHDLLDFCKQAFGSGDFGSASCEVLADTLGRTVFSHYGRKCKVKVFEDGEVGAVVKQ